MVLKFSLCYSLLVVGTLHSLPALHTQQRLTADFGILNLLNYLTGLADI